MGRTFHFSPLCMQRVSGSMRQGQKIAWSPLWSNAAQRELCGESSTTLHLEGKALPDEGQDSTFWYEKGGTEPPCGFHPSRVFGALSLCPGLCHPPCPTDSNLSARVGIPMLGKQGGPKPVTTGTWGEQETFILQKPVLYLASLSVKWEKRWVVEPELLGLTWCINFVSSSLLTFCLCTKSILILVPTLSSHLRIKWDNICSRPGTVPGLQ